MCCFCSDPLPLADISEVTVLCYSTAAAAEVTHLTFSMAPLVASIAATKKVDLTRDASDELNHPAHRSRSRTVPRSHGGTFQLQPLALP